MSEATVVCQIKRFLHILDTAGEPFLQACNHIKTRSICARLEGSPAVSRVYGGPPCQDTKVDFTKSYFPPSLLNFSTPVFSLSCADAWWKYTSAGVR